MKLTIGMAHANDFHGVYFTVQALRMYHDLTDCEIVVVDSTPDTRHGKEVQKFIKGTKGEFTMRYLTSDIAGTSQPRNLVFDVAKGEYVICMDCHVLLDAFAIQNLLAFYDAHPDAENLYTGPLRYDTLNQWSTHFSFIWREQMWGVWSSAWHCSGEDCDMIFEVHQNKGNGLIKMANMFTHEHYARCPKCNRPMPQGVKFHGHENVLNDRGMRVAAKNPDDTPFAIPGQGLGFFTCKKSAWLEFNRHFRGFGGEEGYIHEKYRQAGHETVLLPFLGWNHRFGRPDGTQYPITVAHKVRNYVLGHQELGLPLDSIEEHFASTNIFPRNEWDRLIEEPIGYVAPALKKPNQASLPIAQQEGKAPVIDYPQQAPVPLKNGQAIQDTTEIFEWMHTGDGRRDMDQHFDTMTGLVDRVKEDNEGQCHILEISKRRETVFVWLSRKPTRVVSFQLYKDLTSDLILPEIMKKEEHPTKLAQLRVDLSKMDAVEDTDILFIDSFHNETNVYDELQLAGKHSRRFIAFRGTYTNGQNGEHKDQRGLAYGISRWMSEQDEGREWFVCDNSLAQYGFTVISKDERDRPPKRVHAWPPGFGTGAYVKTFLERWLNIVATATCKCTGRAHKMDMEGADWCEENIEVIMGWMREEFDIRKSAHDRDPERHPPIKVPFVKMVVRKMIKKGIKEARKLEKTQGDVIHALTD